MLKPERHSSGHRLFETVHQQGTITDPYGLFSLQTTPGEQELVVSFIGYETFRKTFDLKKDTVLSVALKPKVFTTGDVKVVGSGSLWNINTTQGSANTLTPRDIDQIPTLLGEKDVMKAIQMLPGVQGGTEGSSDLIVRGGGPGQNLGTHRWHPGFQCLTACLVSIRFLYPKR